MTLQAVDAVGEILLSLSYLPTAERLTVVVAKCKNLVWTNNKTTAGQMFYILLLARLICACFLCRRYCQASHSLSLLILLLLSDPFVKVYLLQDGRKISKKKTSTKRDDTNPIFNEAMIFSVPSIVLQVESKL